MVFFGNRLNQADYVFYCKYCIFHTSVSFLYALRLILMLQKNWIPAISDHYDFDEIKVAIPTIINIRSPAYTIPAAAIQIRMMGNITMVINSFVILHAAFIPRINNFPITHIRHTVNIIANIFPAFTSPKYHSDKPISRPSLSPP